MEKTWVMSDKERKEYCQQLEEKRKQKQGESSKDADMVKLDNKHYFLHP